MKLEELIGQCARHMTGTPLERDADPAALIVVLLGWLGELVERGAIPRPTFTLDSFMDQVPAGCMRPAEPPPLGRAAGFDLDGDALEGLTPRPVVLTRAVAYSTMRESLNRFYGRDSSTVIEPMALEMAIFALFQRCGIP